MQVSREAARRLMIEKQLVTDFPNKVGKKRIYDTVDALGRTVAAAYAGEEEAELYGGRRIRVADLGIENRKKVKESFKV